jgi:transposase
MIDRQSSSVKIWVATTPVDMRRSFDRLSEHVRSFLGHDPLSGNLFVFRNRNGHMLKILWWDTNGLVIYYKRLEKGVFQFPSSTSQALTIERDQLRHLLAGCSIAGTSRP